MLSSPTTAAGVGPTPQQPRFEVADIVREYGAAFRATHHVSHEQERVLHAIEQCRTVALGGTSRSARRAGRSRSLTTPVVIATAPSAKAVPGPSG